MNKATMTPEQMTHAHHAYHYAIAAAGGEVDGVVTNKQAPSTKTQFIIAAWEGVRLAGLKVKRPRGPVDAVPLARSISELCAQMGIDANTGMTIQTEATFAGLPIAELEPIALTEEDDELEPERKHRCKDGGDGYCAVCLVDHRA